MAKRQPLALIVVLILSLFVFDSSDQRVSAQPQKDSAPSFTLQLLDGAVLHSSELRGKVTVLKFVASW